MEGAIVLSVTLLAFLAGGLYILITAIKGPKLPKGHSFIMKEGKNKVTLIVDKKVPGIHLEDDKKIHGWFGKSGVVKRENLVKSCMKALVVTEQAFANKGVQKADEDHVVFFYATDSTFESGSEWWQEWSKNASAYSTALKGKFSRKKLPMAVIRSKFIQDAVERGQPAIHELVHILNYKAKGDYSHNHSDPVLWLGPGGSTSVEGVAVENFKKTQ